MNYLDTLQQDDSAFDFNTDAAVGDVGDTTSDKDTGDPEDHDLVLPDSSNADSNDDAPYYDARIGDGDMAELSEDSSADGNGVEDGSQNDSADDSGLDVDNTDTSGDGEYESNVALQSDLAPWEEVLLLEFDFSNVKGEKTTAKTSQNDPAIASLFDGETTPSASSVVLHVGPGCLNQPARAVLLVHGAGSNGQQSWVDPLFGGDGLAAFWIEQSTMCVLAVTFPHPFGDNLNQAIQLAFALQKTRELTGLSKVDVIAHSKGGIVVLALLNGFAQKMVGIEYQGDIGHLVVLGTPMAGMDFSFRHPAFNYPAEMLQLAMPSSWYQILEWGQWKDIYDDSIYGGSYDGVLQTTYAWDNVFTLSVLEQDWYTTYYGGTGFVSKSLGIAEAISMSGNFMSQLREHKTPPGVPVSVGYGSNWFVNGVIWEGTGPSDGMVFVESASDTTMLTDIVEVHEFVLLNHWDLITSSSSWDWVSDQLGL